MPAAHPAPLPPVSTGLVRVTKLGAAGRLRSVQTAVGVEPRAPGTTEPHRLDRASHDQGHQPRGRVLVPATGQGLQLPQAWVSSSPCTG